LVSFKILAIIAFIFLANPTATHAIIDAGYTCDVDLDVDVDETTITVEEKDDLAI
jgi:multisubunit Na+/H+ antiporter MnhG subunit